MFETNTDVVNPTQQLPLSLFTDEHGFHSEPRKKEKVTIESLVISQALDQYSDVLLKSPYYQVKLESLGVSDLSVISRFGVGYVDRTLPQLLPHPKSFDGSSIRGMFQRCGLLAPNGREVFRAAFTFPFKNLSNEVIGLSGHWETKGKCNKEPYVINWSGNELGVFNLRVIQELSVVNEPSKVIFCQNALDACRLLSLGYENVVALVIDLPNLNAFLSWLKQIPSKGLTVSLYKEDSPFGLFWESELSMALRLLAIDCEQFIDV